MTKQEIMKLKTSDEILNEYKSSGIWDDDIRERFNFLPHEEFKKDVIELNGSYDPNTHYDFVKK